MTRFNDVHLGTGKKTTLKDIPLSPGPGQYLRVDEQYPRTFHHSTKHGTSISPMFSTVNQHSVKAFKQAMMMSDTNRINEETTNDLAEAKRNSVIKQNSTANHFFGEPTGAEAFYENLMTGVGPKKL